MSIERALVAAMVTFAVAVGGLGLVAMAMALLQLAADTAGALTAAGIGATISIPLARRKGK